MLMDIGATGYLMESEPIPEPRIKVLKYTALIKPTILSSREAGAWNCHWYSAWCVIIHTPGAKHKGTYTTVVIPGLIWHRFPVPEQRTRQSPLSLSQGIFTWSTIVSTCVLGKLPAWGFNLSTVTLVKKPTLILNRLPPPWCPQRTSMLATGMISASAGWRQITPGRGSCRGPWAGLSPFSQ